MFIEFRMAFFWPIRLISMGFHGSITSISSDSLSLSGRSICQLKCLQPHLELSSRAQPEALLQSSAPPRNKNCYEKAREMVTTQGPSSAAAAPTRPSLGWAANLVVRPCLYSPNVGLHCLSGLCGFGGFGELRVWLHSVCEVGSC